MPNQRTSRVAPWLLLILTWAGLIAAWAFQPREQPQPESMLYLHIYSTRYNIHSMGELKPLTDGPECIATFGVTPGAPFFAYLPNHYEPELSVSGRLDDRGDTVDCQFSIEIQDVGTAFTHEQTRPIAKEVLAPFWNQDEFRLAVSSQNDPYALDYRFDGSR